MTYDAPLPPAATLSDRAIGVSSLSKADGLPGIRIGWLMTRDDALLERCLAAKEQILITGFGRRRGDRRGSPGAPARAAAADPRGHRRRARDRPGLARRSGAVRVGRAAWRRRRLPALPARRAGRPRRVLPDPAGAVRDGRRTGSLVRPAAAPLPARVRLADADRARAGPRGPDGVRRRGLDGTSPGSGSSLRGPRSGTPCSRWIARSSATSRGSRSWSRAAARRSGWGPTAD